MVEIIDIHTERMRRVTDGDCRCVDQYGNEWFLFDVHFTHPNHDAGNPKASYSFHLWAKDERDAEARLESVRANARIDGRLLGVIPV